MWENPVTQANVETLTKRGVRWTGPTSGRLACGTEGIGRMAEPQDIVDAIEKIALNIKQV
jgi:phosphopantothenoylcysteine decarboxylase/phosphopantothenate--cysteine ligase